ncbi:chemotaxis protein CheB [Luteimonas sp. TWI662]|uniref:chemotaxis protein CheB n=1 Tax=Luteimonas sp. TWI662 TaxID=3136789 RepID=UPI0032095C91
MRDPALRVVVLARPGPVCDRLAAAVVEAGADAAVQIDPLRADAEQVDALAPAAIVVALEPVIADAIEALAPVLARSGRMVVFEDADRVLERSGDAAAHWVRQLGAKLRLREDRGSDADAAQTGDASNASSGNAAYAFDPVAAEYDDPPHAPFELDFGFDGSDDRADAAPMPPATADSAPVAAAADAAERDQDHDVLGVPSADIDLLPSFRGLADESGPPPPIPPAHDLADLEQRIAGLALADADSYGHGPERGLVLMDGGLGSPDAVRQLLGALPEDFPRPILVRLHLESGRYDQLVRQMARVAAMPVHLAEPGMAIAPGAVYVLPPDLQPQRTGGHVRFATGGDPAAITQAMPAADSAWLLLSGADPALVPLATAPAWQGALVVGQDGAGCYDPTAAQALNARGHQTGTPPTLAAWVIERWMPGAGAPQHEGWSL